ncbi:MAG TPA: glycosyltransferase family 2 protein [Candidatus Dormibacteraeota bacterium]|nr:glycosyltransferase family 2 protein [Candidatus Dormibacteraeota bacterium]
MRRQGERARGAAAQLPAGSDAPSDGRVGTVIQVVLYRSQQWVPGLVASLNQLEPGPAPFQVAFWNNAPGDGTTEQIRRARPRFTYTVVDAPDGNIGFGAAHNRLATAGPPAQHLLLLNPDTLIFYDCLTRLLAAARTCPTAGLLEAAQFPIEHPKVYEAATGHTNWCAATCLLVPRALFVELGGFDPALFLYCEDVDLSWRVWLRGRSCLYVPPAKCAHLTRENETGKEPLLEVRQSWIGHLYLRRKFFGAEALAEGMAMMRRRLPPAEVATVLQAFAQLPATVHRNPGHPRVQLTADGNYAPTRW